MVFFIPLIVAGIHLVMAFPLISKILGLLHMTNTRLHMICVGGSYACFAVAYVIIYFLTARTYLKIVGDK